MVTLTEVTGAVATSTRHESTTQVSQWFQWAEVIILAVGTLAVLMLLLWLGSVLLRGAWAVVADPWVDCEQKDGESVHNGGGEVRRSVHNTGGEVAHAPVVCLHGSFVPGVHGSNPGTKCVACDLSHVLFIHAQLEDGLFRTRAILSDIQSTSIHSCHEQQ